MADNNKAHNRPEDMITPDDNEQIPLPTLPDIISLEDLDIPETEVAGYTVDIGYSFTSPSEQRLRFLALEQIIHRHIDEYFQAERGLRSVVSIGDKEKVGLALDPSKLYLFDTTTQIFELSLSPVDSHALVGKINYGSSLFHVGRLNLSFPNFRYIVVTKFFVVLKPLAASFADWIRLFIPSKIPLSILVFI